ncbi:MAG TPA: hypothetical protein VGK76_04815 [Candidatus Eisenbacteria bacterium]|jgi:hypothetical protein
MFSSERSFAAAAAWIIGAAGLITALIFAGCAREAPDVREARKAAHDYLRAVARRDVKEIGERSTCLASTTSFAGGRVLRVDPPRGIRMAALDSLVRVSVYTQRSADSAWAHANETDADSLFRRARLRSYQASVYRAAARAVPVSAPGAVVGRDTMLETRALRVRVRYAGPLVGPRPVDKEEILRMLRVPAGKWIVFSMFLVSDDPAPEMI